MFALSPTSRGKLGRLFRGKPRRSRSALGADGYFDENFLHGCEISGLAEPFIAVGAHYRAFPQVSDEEVVVALNQAAGATPDPQA